MSPKRMAGIVGPIALALLAIVPFVGGVHGEFIEDDLGIIRDNPDLRAGGDLLAVFGENYWRDVWGGLYRPLTVFSYGVDRIVWGDEPEGGPPDPFGVHVDNLLLNALAAVLLYLVLRRRLPAGSGWPAWSAWIGAALFAVHPVHTEAVVHMVGRADLLAGVFFLGAWLLHGRGRPGSRLLAAALYLASLLCKESGVALPAVLLCEAWILGQRQGGLAFLRRMAIELAPYAVALALFLLLRGLVLGANADPPQAFLLYSPGGYVAFRNPAAGEISLTMLHAIGEYLVLLTVPLRLSADYSGFPHHLSPTLPVILSAAGLVALASWAVVTWRRGARAPAVWLSLLFWTLLPASNLVVVSGIVLAERVLYLPSIALSGLVAAATPWLLRRSRLLLVVPLAWITGLAGLAAARAPVWSDPQTLFETTVEEGRFRGHLALTGLCDAYIRAMQGDPVLEDRLLARTVELARESVGHQRTPINVAHLAWALERSGMLGESLHWWEVRRRSAPRNPRMRADVVRVVEAIRGRPGAVGDDMRRAVDVGREALGFARRRGDRPGILFWVQQTTRLLATWIERTVERREWVPAMGACLLLEELDPRHPLLGGRVEIYAEALRVLRARGAGEGARQAAEALLRVAPDHPLARDVLGR